MFLTKNMGLSKFGKDDNFSNDILSKNFDILDKELARFKFADIKERKSVVIPLYIYPYDPNTKGLASAYSTIANLKTNYKNVPCIAIVNPGNGPGEEYDEWYKIGITTLKNAGCYVMGYVMTGYADRAKADVLADVDAWMNLYPQIDGIFFDEMIYLYIDSDDYPDPTKHPEYWKLQLYKDYNSYVKETYGFSMLTYGNPGTAVTEIWFENDVFDMFCIYENSALPSVGRVDGSEIPHYLGYPCITKSILCYNVAALPDESVIKQMLATAASIYISDGDAGNPWDSIPAYLGDLFRILNKMYLTGLLGEYMPAT